MLVYGGEVYEGSEIGPNGIGGIGMLKPFPLRRLLVDGVVLRRRLAKSTKFRLCLSPGW